MDQNHPREDRPRNGTPLEGEYYPEQQAPRQHFPHGYSQQSRGPVCGHGYTVHQGKHPSGQSCDDPHIARQEAAYDLGAPVTGFHSEGYPGQNPFVNPAFYAQPKTKKKVWPWIVGGILLLALIACGLSTLVIGDVN